jgi:hypothetical protein
MRIEGVVLRVRNRRNALPDFVQSLRTEKLPCWAYFVVTRNPKSHYALHYGGPVRE